MTDQNLIIFNLPVIFDVLNEIQDNLNFKISKVNNKNDLKRTHDNLSNNSIILADLKSELNEINNKIVLTDFPLKIKNVIEIINVKFLKLKYNKQSEVNVKNYEINLNSREISFQNKKIKLTEKEIEIILFLNSSDKERTVEELKKKVWNYKAELDTHTVETHVYRLRKKIKENFGINKLIISTKKGYKIA